MNRPSIESTNTERAEPASEPNDPFSLDRLQAAPHEGESMSFLRIIGILFIAACLLVAVFLFSARLHDGPISGFAGGPLESGEWAASQGTNFSYAEDIPTIELQLIHPLQN